MINIGDSARGTDIEDGEGLRVGLSFMLDTATALLALFSIGIFLAHALDAYNAN